MMRSKVQAIITRIVSLVCVIIIVAATPGCIVVSDSRCCDHCTVCKKCKKCGPNCTKPCDLHDDDDDDDD